MKGINLLKRWTRLDRTRQLALIEAVATLAAASTAVRILPFRHAIRLGSRRLSDVPGDRSLADARWAIEAASRRTPWRTVCLQKGIALQWMLRRRGVDASLHYGIARDKAGGLEAHVWVAANERVIIGGEEAERFQRVATFP